MNFFVQRLGFLWKFEKAFKKFEILTFYLKALKKLKKIYENIFPKFYSESLFKKKSLTIENDRKCLKSISNCKAFHEFGSTQQIIFWVASGSRLCEVLCCVCKTSLIGMGFDKQASICCEGRNWSGNILSLTCQCVCLGGESTSFVLGEIFWLIIRKIKETKAKVVKT